MWRRPRFWCGPKRFEKLSGVGAGRRKPESRPSPLQGSKRFPGLLFYLGMKAVAVRIHGDDGGKIVDFQMPHRLRNPEFEEMHAEHTLYGTSVVLRRASDS